MSIEVTKDEADKKQEYLRILARRGEGDRSRVFSERQDLHPRWVQKRRVEERKTLGYDIVRPNEGIVSAAGGSLPDNTIGLKDDLVLMAEPRELYEMKRDQDREKAVSRFKKKMESDVEALNKKARDEGLVGPHQTAVVDRSREGDISESRTIARRKLPS